ncbi:MAG: FAD-binding oxidoreductase [Ruminococcaceae bacterium]|nr:FAD-binding oxidoreductase [Oscillospiraceae bacterium]
MESNLISRLKSALGEDRVLTEQEQRTKRATDLLAIRLLQRHMGWKPTLPLCVVEPENTEELARAVAICRENKVPIIPYGGGSGVLGGAECRDTNAVVIDVKRLNKIGELSDEDLCITAEAGVMIKDLEAYVNEKGYILGHYPQSMDLAQMGGLVATRSIGQFSTQYGGIEDLLLGMEGVLPNGEVVEIKANPRKSAGPDLRHIFLGGEGFVGIVARVTVKVFPKPEATWKQAYRVEGTREGLEVIRKVMREGIKPAVVRLHDWLECEKPYGAFMEEDESLILFLCEGAKEKVRAEQEIIERVVGTDAISAGEKPVDIWLAHRNDAADEYEEYGKQGLLVDTIEISGNWSDIGNIYENTIDRVYDEVHEVLFLSGHSSHSYLNGTNIYFQIGAMPSPDMSSDDVEKLHRRIWDIIEEETVKNGGAIAHHHGIGKHRAKYMESELGSGLKMLKTIKKAFDPDFLMNPGTLINCD